MNRVKKLAWGNRMGGVYRPVLDCCGNHQRSNSMTLTQAKNYLGDTYILSPEYDRDDNPAHSYRDGAYWLQPENIEAAREMVKEIA